MPQAMNNGVPSGYDALPECIKQYYSEQEYNWLSDSQKANLLRENTEPDEE